MTMEEVQREVVTKKYMDSSTWYEITVLHGIEDGIEKTELDNITFKHDGNIKYLNALEFVEFCKMIESIKFDVANLE